jgi:hypothetical protein
LHQFPHTCFDPNLLLATQVGMEKRKIEWRGASLAFHRFAILRATTRGKIFLALGSWMRGWAYDQPCMLWHN